MKLVIQSNDMNDKTHDTASHDRISETTETQIQYLCQYISKTTSDLTVSLEKSFSVRRRNIYSSSSPIWNKHLVLLVSCFWKSVNWASCCSFFFLFGACKNILSCLLYEKAAEDDIDDEIETVNNVVYMNNHSLHETRTVNTSNKQEEMDKYWISSWTLNKLKNTSYPLWYYLLLCLCLATTYLEAVTSCKLNTLKFKKRKWRKEVG